MTEKMLFIIFAVLAVAGGIATITRRNVVHGLLFLVFTFLNVAAIFFLTRAYFLAVVQILVYAGAIMVLFLFVIMLLNVERQRPTPRWTWFKPTATAIGLLGAVAIAFVLFTDRQPLPGADTISGVLQGGNAEQIGTVLFSDYLLAFHLVGVLLLTGIIGAVSLVQRATPSDPARGAVTARHGGTQHDGDGQPEIVEREKVSA